MKPITLKQQKVLDFIRSEVERCNYPPSVREICRALGFRSSSTAHAYLGALQEKGYLRRDPAKPRAIELLDPALAGMERRCTYAPLIGRAPAGRPFLAEENFEGFFPLPADLGGEGTFVLQVSGESMTGAGILDGDYVIVRRQETAENGEIVVALLENEATVKRFYRNQENVRLQPENPAYEPIVTREVQILGKVTGIFRRL